MRANPLKMTLSIIECSGRPMLLALLFLLITASWIAAPAYSTATQSVLLHEGLPGQSPPQLREFPPQTPGKEAHGSLPSFYRIEVPYHQQATSYWCGPACLQMLFDYYGPNIPQGDIAEVAASDPSYGTYTGDLIRAAHFSCTSTDPEGQLRGYNQRRLGYPAYSHHWTGTYTEICTSLKSLIADGTPLLILTWYDENHVTGHYRLLVGYNDTSSTFLLHDPWYSGQYHGPNQPIDQQLLITDLWSRYNRWAMTIQPWTLKVSAVPLLIRPGQIITITLTVEAPCPQPFRSSQLPLNDPHANITLPSGFILLGGGGTVPLTFTGGQAEARWVLQAPHLLLQNRIEIEVAAGATVSGIGTKTGEYTDIVGAETTLTLDALPGYSPFIVIIAAGGAAAACAAAIIIIIRRRRKSPRLQSG